jgi:hypothetical protein
VSAEVSARGFTAISAVLWIEFKALKGQPSKAQLDWHAKERARGALTWIAGVDFPASVEGFRAHYLASGLARSAEWCQRARLEKLKL